MLRRPVLLACALALALPVALPASSFVGTASAAETKAFTSSAFEAAKKAGGPILIDVTAPWCPTCKAQKPILSELLADPRFAKMTVLHVDFDSQKDALKELGVRMQSTLISYKGGREVGRSTGVTDKAAIAAQLDTSI
ncbi:thioredoxin family protein [Methylobacterium aquaticum]|uniref:Thioredoxin n=1 Tax=Methylobacterium aquaticum TaxID=270351 RepID=A0A0J6S6S3_9HYPH|nr:thioredoxin family protein [Methylobacterium aquaticum]KMO29399.1 thioredoxin [Methylobacterium aquaticum]